MWNCGASGVLEETRQVEQGLPFRLRGLDFDSRGQWLNWHLIRYLQERAEPVRLTRLRPYHSNDNALVEQKNWMWQRQLPGYGRMEAPDLVPPINHAYVKLWGPLHNFFRPYMKWADKQRIGACWQRKHDPPQTACQRLLKVDVLSVKRKRELREWYGSLDPFVLHEQIEKALRPILTNALEGN